MEPQKRNIVIVGDDNHSKEIKIGIIGAGDMAGMTALVKATIEAERRGIEVVCVDLGPIDPDNEAFRMAAEGCDAVVLANKPKEFHRTNSGSADFLIHDKINFEAFEPEPFIIKSIPREYCDEPIIPRHTHKRPYKFHR